MRQSYTVTREVYNKKGKLKSEKVIGRNLPVVPSNIGPKTMPNYGALANEGIKTISGGGKVFAGQRDDPFFVDLGQTFDSINFRPGVGTGNQGGGKDDLAGYNVNSIVLQVPKAQVTRDGKPVAAADAPNAVVGVWSSTERRRFQVTNDDRRPAQPGPVGPGQPAGQPAGERGRDPARVRRTGSTGRSRRTTPRTTASTW